MIYKVIGLMSGSSLDGLDIAFVKLEDVRGQWSYEILEAECVPYDDKWTHQLRTAAQLNVPDFLQLHTAYGRYTGDAVNAFIEKYQLQHQVQFITSHGHTVFHNPSARTTWQLGDGASIAAITQLPVVSDLRAVDVALGGQGAPIVPIGDKLLFADYDYLLNIGGIANLTTSGSNYVAFDVCAANQILNQLATRNGAIMDESGAMAASGVLLGEVLDQLNALPYYSVYGPKSLSNEQAVDMIFPILNRSSHNTNDLLHTVVVHIAQQVAKSVKHQDASGEPKKMLITGGGAFNDTLVKAIAQHLAPLNVTVTVPEERVVKYKEALVMALIGVLRWRDDENVMSSVTGASRDSIAGALWMV